MRPFLAALLSVAAPLALASAPNAPPTTQVEVTTTLPATADPCIDHAVKDLGMSPKKEGRSWTIGGEKLHGSTRAGKLLIRVNPSPEGLPITITARWDGGPKPREVQGEIETRLTEIARKLGQSCGTIEPKTSCTVTSGSTSSACAFSP